MFLHYSRPVNYIGYSGLICTSNAPLGVRLLIRLPFVGSFRDLNLALGDPYPGNLDDVTPTEMGSGGERSHEMEFNAKLSSVEVIWSQRKHLPLYLA